MKYRPELPKSGWYTYGLFLRGVPFYIGKGSGKRALNHFYPSYLESTSNPWKSSIIKKYKSEIEVQILTTHSEESDAFETEKFLIASYGLRSEGGTLVNFTEGGEGSSGVVVSEELKLKRGNSIRKFSKESFTKALELYYLDGKSQEEVSELLGVHQTQFSRSILGKTKSLVNVLEEFMSLHPYVDFRNYSKNRQGFQPRENT